MGFFNRLFGKKVRNSPTSDIDWLRHPFDQFISADTLDESQHIVEQNQVLLHPDVDDLLVQLASLQPDERAKELVEHGRILLQRCREVGIARAFAELQFSPNTLAEADAAGISPEELLAQVKFRDFLTELAAGGVEIRSPEDLEWLVATRPDVRARLGTIIPDLDKQINPPQHLEQEFLNVAKRQQQAGNQPQIWSEIVTAWERFLQLLENEQSTYFYASVKGNLALALVALYQVANDDISAQRAVRLFGELSSQFTQSLHPRRWATLHLGLGKLYLLRYERSGNDPFALKAEHHFACSLEELRREEVPAQWAYVQNNLGTLFVTQYERSGNNVYALRAAHHLTSSLEEYGRETAPAEWALVQQQLGLLNFHRYERSSNDLYARQADVHYTNALEECRREVAPEEWFFLQYSLGNLYVSQYQRSNKDVHARRAEQYYASALEECQRDVAPAQWADLQHSLGYLYYLCYEYSDDDAHARQAEWHFTSALEERQRDIAPAQWGMTQQNLGALFVSRYRNSGDVTHARQAVEHYANALAECQRESAPEQWAGLQNGLGYLCYLRYEESGDDNYAREADQHLANALDLYRREITPANWALAQLNLGNLYSQRYARSGDEAHFYQADQHYVSALTEFQREILPAQWAMTQRTLGDLYSRRYAYSRNDVDFRRAVQHYTVALEEYRRDIRPADWTMTQHNLGILYFTRYELSGEDEHARLSDEHLTNALKECRRELTPVQWATVQYNLGNLYNRRYEHMGDDAYARKSNQHYTDALEERMQDTAPFDWAMIQQGQGILHVNRHERSRDGSDASRADQHLTAVLVLANDFPVPDVLLFHAARALARLHFRQEDWSQTVENYYHASLALRNILLHVSTRANKESWLMQAQGYAAQAAYALAKLQRLEEAAEALEAGRALLLAEALESNRRDLERLEEMDKGDLLARYENTARQLDNLQQMSGQSAGRPAGGPDYETLGRRIAHTRAELDAAIGAIRLVPGYEDFFLSPSFEKIQRAATPGAPLVYLVTTSTGSVALVVRAAAQKSAFSPPSSVEAVWLDGFSDDDLNALLVRRDEGRVIGGYLPGQLGDHDALEDSLAQALPQLGERLMKPLAAHLREQAVDSAVLVPAGRLSLLPLHAASYAVDDQDRCFLDEFSVHYAPSAGALATAQSESLRRHAPLSLAGVGNPLPDLDTGVWASQRARVILDRLPVSSSNEYLNQARQILQSLADAPSQEVIRAGELLMRTIQALTLGNAPVALVTAVVEIAQRIPPSLNYAEAELRSMLDLLTDDVAWTAFNNEATRDALWQALPDATWLHLACHGQFNPQEPLNSALLLAAGTRITLRELLDRQQATALAGIRLAFLSACQTAITDYNNVPDESVGLPAGFLQAGIPAVVGTLWPVNDASTALLVTRFYEFHLNGDPATGLPPQPPASALRLAQQWLRDVTNKELAAYLDGHHRLKEASERELQRMSWTLIKEARREVRRAMRQGHGDARPFESAYHWAPFVFYGAG